MNISQARCEDVTRKEWGALNFIYIPGGSTKKEQNETIKEHKLINERLRKIETNFHGNKSRV